MNDELVFLPLGGSGEIGMNLNLFGIGPRGRRQWIMVDCGVTFGRPEDPGIDLITADPAYLLDEIDEGATLLALVLTHGHEDHLGAVAHLWPEFECDVYATPFTAELARRKFEDLGIARPPIKVVDLRARFSIGPFDLQLITLTHSIPEPNAIAIRTKFGTVLHTGDWKIDPTPVLGLPTEVDTLESLSAEGVIAMICDSTNVFSEGRSGSELDVARNLSALINEQTGRVAVTTFASNVSRLVSVCRAAKECGRSVCLLGRSMHRMIEVSRQVGLLPPGVSFVEPSEARFLPKNRILYLCTGSQGEARAALARIAQGDHPELSLEVGDTVIFSSRIIPGNERTIFDLMNMFVESGVTIVTAEDAFIHTSGHPCRDELRDMYGWVKPACAIPVHGEARHLREHAALAKEIGVPRTLVPRNGSLIRLAPGNPEIIDEVPSGRLYVDGRILLPDGDPALKDRRRLATDGLIVVALAFNKDGRPVGKPELLLRGVPVEDNDGEVIAAHLQRAVQNLISNMPKPRLNDDREVEAAVRRAIRGELSPRWGKRGDIEVMIVRS